MYQVLLNTKAEGEDEVKKLTKDDGDTEEKLVSKSITMVQDTAKKTAHKETMDRRLEEENR